MTYSNFHNRTGVGNEIAWHQLQRRLAERIRLREVRQRELVAGGGGAAAPRRASHCGSSGTAAAAGG